MNKFDQQNIKRTKLDGLYVIERPIYKDQRGYFKEVFRLDKLKEEIGFNFSPKQWNHSYSVPNTLRGLHAENWNKIIYIITGKVFVAIVDIRPESITFGQAQTFNIDSKSPKALFIQEGLANSSCVVGKEPAHYLYLVDAYYDGKDTRAVAWDDPDLNINWPIKSPILSERDKKNPTLRELFPEKFK